MNTSIFKIVSMAAVMSGAAFAVDIDVNIGTSRPPRTVVVQPSPVVERVWVPERVVERSERVLVEPARVERRSEKVLVQAAQVIRKEERVLVEPARIQKVKETIVVQPARTGREYIPPVTENVKVGPVRVTRTIREGYWREFPIEAEYRTVYREVEIPAKYDTVYREIEVPARYEVVYKDVESPARYRDVVRREVVPGYWQERVVTPPSQIVVEPSRPSGINIDLDLSKKRNRRD